MTENPDIGLGPDFSTLPEVAWVSIMSYLELHDRNQVAQTCHVLSDIFSHPSLWHTAKIYLLGHSSPTERVRTFMPEVYKEMITRYGCYFQNLTLRVAGFFNRFPQDSLDVIHELAARCRLRELTLDIGVVLSKSEFFQHMPRNSELDLMVDFVVKSFRLKSFYLKAWPLKINPEDIDILDALVKNHKLKDLERLSLFWKREETHNWATLNAVQPLPHHIFTLVRHFKNLSHLSLRSAVLNEDIVKELSQSNHASLKSMSILVTFSRSEPSGGIPEISASDWRDLHSHNLDLKIDITVLTRMPYIELAGFLKPELRVHSLCFMKYSQPSNEDVISIGDKYCDYLQKFSCFAETEGLDMGLQHLVVKCKNLDHLEYHGSLNYKTVMMLSKSKGPFWHTFRFLLKNISFMDMLPVDEFDEDIVVIETSPGHVELVETVRQRQLEEDLLKHNSRQQEMIQIVSESINQRWDPISN